MGQVSETYRTGLFQLWCVRLFLWIPVLAAVFGVTYWLTRIDREIAFQKALVELIEGRFDSSIASLRSLQSRIWDDREAAAAARISQALLGKSTSESFPISGLAAQRIPVRLLLADALRRANYAGCLELARISGEIVGREALLYEAAALLELGDRARSAQLVRQLPAPVSATWLGTRITQVHSVLDQDAAALLQDRKGIPIGWVTKAGRIRYFDPSDTILFPTTVLERMLPGNLTPSIRLTLDRDLSRVALQALGRFRGSIVLVTPSSGEVLVAVSDRTSSKGGAVPAFEQELEPASIAKLITTTASLRSGLDADDAISHMVCRGVATYAGEYLFCPYRAGRLSGLDEALALSCNIAFANLGQKVGSRRLLDELGLFGFGLPAKDGMHFGQILNSSLNDRQLADLSIGLEVSAVTPLHAALIASVFANGGKLVEPNLIAGRDGWLGLSAQAGFTPKSRQIIEPAWIPALLKSMRAVVGPGGTAFGIEPDDFRVAMKTGTAATPGRGYHTNYIGVGPLPEGNVGFCIRVTNQRTSKEVRWATQTVARKLLEGLRASRSFLGEPEPLPLNWTYQLAQLSKPDLRQSPSRKPNSRRTSARAR